MQLLVPPPRLCLSSVSFSLVVSLGLSEWFKCFGKHSAKHLAAGRGAASRVDGDEASGTWSVGRIGPEAVLASDPAW